MTTPQRPATPAEFDDIRCYEARDLRAVFDALMADEQFLALLPYIYNNVSLDELREKLYSCTDELDFQKKFVYALVRQVMARASTGFTCNFASLPDKATPYTFISNHRDIVLDSALLSEQLVEQGFPTTVEIAIGDNLLIYPWIRHIVRLNKAFIVQRSLGLRETLLASQKMSRYMHFVVREKRDPIWIAQREGRAKDSNDRTQESVLKMLAMGGEGTPLESLREMNIVPLSISYEYDPCDFLKAREFQLKRDHPDYRKTREDDLENMRTGIFGFKGRVHYQTAEPVNTWLNDLSDLPKGRFYELLAARIDHAIHFNYHLFPSNYLAADLLDHSRIFADQYTEEDREAFEQYLEDQISKIDLPRPDHYYLRERILTMYANPVINHEMSLAY